MVSVSSSFKTRECKRTKCILSLHSATVQRTRFGICSRWKIFHIDADDLSVCNKQSFTPRNFPPTMIFRGRWRWSWWATTSRATVYNRPTRIQLDLHKAFDLLAFCRPIVDRDTRQSTLLVVDGGTCRYSPIHISHPSCSHRETKSFDKPQCFLTIG